MTREEQIIEAGAYHLCGLRPPKTCGHNMHELVYINCNLAFEAGAKWADETMIDKVCEWLDNINPDDYMDSGIFQIHDLIGDLRKAMAE